MKLIVVTMLFGLLQNAAQAEQYVSSAKSLSVQMALPSANRARELRELHGIEFIREFRPKAEFVSFKTLDAKSKAMLPNSWIDLLSFEGEKRIERTLIYWEPFDAEFKEVTMHLRRGLVELQLLRYRSEFSLVYAIRTAKTGEIYYYEARNPRTMKLSKSVQGVWDLLPKKLRQFYEFQNGWFYLPSISNGLLPVEDFELLSDSQWGILDSIPKPSIDLAKSLAVFHNGGEGYLCLDLRDDRGRAFKWWTSDPPNLNKDFWRELDAWTAVDFYN
jgi:hypothetical protein